jgi:hypothetical protein
MAFTVILKEIKSMDLDLDLDLDLSVPDTFWTLYH